MKAKRAPALPKSAAAFLEAYKVTCSITKAAAAAGEARSTHYRLLERSPAYRAAFEKASIQAADTLEDEAVRRAFDGIRKPVIYHGSLVYVPRDPTKKRSKLVPLYEVEYSDSLILALLRAKKPDAYKERVEQQHTGSIDIVDRLMRGRERLAKRNAENPV